MIQSTSPLPRRFTVVVGVDFSPSSDRALATAQTLCTLSRGCWLHAVHALAPGALTSGMAASPFVPPEIEVARIAETRVRLASRVRFAQLPEGSKIDLHVQAGIAHQIITDVARDCGADLILVGTRKVREIRRALASSVSEQVTRDAPCTVITVRPRAIPAAETIEAGCPE